MKGNLILKIIFFLVLIGLINCIEYEINTEQVMNSKLFDKMNEYKPAINNEAQFLRAFSKIIFVIIAIYLYD
jgi:hypothetical protein